jgi:uncharacterized protein (DUF58 family)
VDVKAKEILLRARKDVFSGNLGNNITAFKGDGLDFSEIAEYNYGDDVRKINWKATAKADSLKVNIFNEERELNIVLAFMVSGSVHFGSYKLKQDVMAEVLTLLAFSALKNDNRVQSLFFSTYEERFFEPTKSESIVYGLLDEALKIDVLKKEVDFGAFCDFINGVVKQKSLIFIVGDFYGDIDLSQIAHKNEVYALIVRDRLEENPTLNGSFELIDPNTLSSSEMILDKKVAKEYEKLVKEQDIKLKEHFIKHQSGYGKIYTDEDIFLRLSEILKG